MNLNIPVSIGELFDKISILEIKQKNITDAIKLKNINAELNLLKDISTDYNIDQTLYNKLKKANQFLWDIEDMIRLHESKKDYSDKFIDLARSVYIYNDKRFKIKKEINSLHGSKIIEEKSYQGY